MTTILHAAAAAAALALAAPPAATPVKPAPARRGAPAAPAVTDEEGAAAQAPAPVPPPRGGLDSTAQLPLGEVVATQLGQLANFAPNGDLECFGHWDRAQRRVVLMVLGPRSDLQNARRELEALRTWATPVLEGFVKEQHGIVLRPESVTYRYISRQTREDVVRWEDGQYR
jgi:hypothetical protein